MKIYAKFAALALAIAAVMLGSLPASAQFGPTPSAVPFRPTYRAAITGLATAASATDFFEIKGSATKTIAITQLDCTGIASTAATPDIQVVKRSTANTAGTSTVPVSTGLDSTNAAATASIKAYTVNPTLGTLVGIIDSNKIALPLAATGANLPPLRFVFSDARYTQPIFLRGVTQSVALNGNAATLGTGASLDCSVEWYEF